MDVTVVIQGQVFEWDQDKAAENLRNHRISFEEACQVFFDPFVQHVDASSEDEPREAAIGMTETWNHLFVVHVIRHEDTIRIISARPITPQERRTHEDDE